MKIKPQTEDEVENWVEVFKKIDEKQSEKDKNGRIYNCLNCGYKGGESEFEIIYSPCCPVCNATALSW